METDCGRIFLIALECVRTRFSATCKLRSSTWEICCVRHAPVTAPSQPSGALHSVENPPYIGIPFVVVSGFMGVIATW